MTRKSGIATSIGLAAAVVVLAFVAQTPVDGIPVAVSPGCYWAFTASLFAIVNPIVAVPVFATMTAGRDAAETSRLAAITALVVLGGLVAAALLGREILAFFSIPLPAFRVAGGIIVLLMGLSLLASKASTTSGAAAIDPRSAAICPLAIPLLTGPGAIATVIIEAESASTVCELTAIGLSIGTLVLITYALLRLAIPIGRALGATGLDVIGRLCGMVVTAIAIDMGATGVRGLVAG